MCRTVHEVQRATLEHYVRTRFFTYLLSNKIRQAQKDIVKESAELSGATTETLRNVQLVKSLGLEDQEIDRLNKVNDNILKFSPTHLKQTDLKNINLPLDYYLDTIYPKNHPF